MRRAVVAAAATALALAAPAWATVPLIDYGLTGKLGDNGWYVSPVTITWSIANATSSSGCDVQTVSSDTPGKGITCTAWNGPVQVAVTVPVKVDQTAPSDVAATPARGPDSRSYFTSPVGIVWSGNDVTSGIASCTSLTYDGPDGEGAPTGTCRDRAGNVSAPVPFSLDYDATPPTISDIAATAGPGRADLTWSASPDTARVTVVRDGSPPTTVLDGPATNSFTDTNLAPGTTYSWTVTAIDDAGNAASQRASVTTPVAAKAAATAKKPRAVRLRWRTVRGAAYYNLQLFRGTRKVLSVWPSRPRFRVATTWRFNGARRSLVAGRTYRWYVWAGFGPRSARRYGPLLAHGRFTVPN